MVFAPAGDRRRRSCGFDPFAAHDDDPSALQRVAIEHPIGLQHDRRGLLCARRQHRDEHGTREGGETSQGSHVRYIAMAELSRTKSEEPHSGTEKPHEARSTARGTEHQAPRTGRGTRNQERGTTKHDDNGGRSHRWWRMHGCERGLSPGGARRNRRRASRARAAAGHRVRRVAMLVGFVISSRIRRTSNCRRSRSRSSRSSRSGSAFRSTSGPTAICSCCRRRRASTRFAANVELQRAHGIAVDWLTPDQARAISPGLDVTGVAARDLLCGRRDCRSQWRDDGICRARRRRAAWRSVAVRK